MPDAAGLSFREAGEATAPVALLLHGYPSSSYMWRDVLPVVADAGWRAVAPDLAGFGDSPVDPPGTWERHVASIERFRQALGLERVALVVHDWGGLIGLRWACDQPDAISALVISDTGFFPDGKWHGLAQLMRTPGDGEQLMDNMTHEAFATAISRLSPGTGEDAIAEYWKAYGDEARRRALLELYRSGDFEKLAPYQGRLAALGVPTLILWGGADEFAPVAGAHRLHHEIPGSRLVVLDDVGHFCVDDEPVTVGAEIAGFLKEVREAA